MLMANILSSVPNLSGSHAAVKRQWISIPRNLHLLRELVKRDLSARFAGSALGLVWAVLQPLTLVALYWFVFTVMMPRGGPAGDSDYALYLISGLLPWLGLNEGLTRSATAIVDNASMVRRLTFRSELLVIVPNLTALLFEFVGLGLFLGFLVLTGRGITGIWLLPFAIILQLMLQIGIGCVLATVYVFFRDVSQILGFLLSVVFYLSPILYAVAGRFERIFFWNPMTPLLGLFRSSLLSSPLPSIGSVVFILSVAVAAFAGGLFVFRRAQPAFVDQI